MYNNYEERIELLNKQLVSEYKRAEELEERINKSLVYLNNTIKENKESFDGEFLRKQNVYELIRLLKRRTQWIKKK